MMFPRYEKCGEKGVRDESMFLFCLMDDWTCHHFTGVRAGLRKDEHFRFGHDKFDVAMGHGQEVERSIS